MEQSAEHGLKRELRLADLVLMQVLLIVGLTWIGNAAVQGSTHVLLWVAGIAFFYVPLAAVVMRLSRAIPVEGGAYQWIKTGISPFAGYMAVWNTSFYTIFVFGVMGPTLVDSLAYIAGPSGAWMPKSTPLILATAIVTLLAVFAANVRGLRLGKWITGSGSILTIGLSVLLVYLLARRWVSGIAPAHPPFSMAMPALSVLTLNVFTKMSIGALSGFDNASVFAGECRSPGRDLPRSVMLSAPIIAVIYILGTGAMLSYVAPGKIDLAAPLQQVMQAGFGNAGLGQILTVVSVGALMLNTVAGAVAMVGLTARFPMVIGWDRILPHWWTHLHPTFRTPVRGLAAVTSACILVALVSSWGAGGQEIVQIGNGAAIASLGVMYTLLFSVVLFGKGLPDGRLGFPIRLAGLSGFVVSLLSIPFQVVPLTGVPNPAIFGLKVGGLILGINALGAWLYWQGVRRRDRQTGEEIALKDAYPPQNNGQPAKSKARPPNNLNIQSKRHTFLLTEG